MIPSHGKFFNPTNPGAFFILRDMLEAINLKLYFSNHLYFSAICITKMRYVQYLNNFFFHSHLAVFLAGQQSMTMCEMSLHKENRHTIYLSVEDEIYYLQEVPITIVYNVNHHYSPIKLLPRKSSRTIMSPNSLITAKQLYKLMLLLKNSLTCQMQKLGQFDIVRH